MEAEKCKARVPVKGDNWGRKKKCSRWARKEGYCTQHHPDAVKEREEASAERWNRKQNLRMRRLTALSEVRQLKEKLDRLDALFQRWASSGDAVAASYAAQAKLVMEEDDE